LASREAALVVQCRERPKLLVNHHARQRENITGTAHNAAAQDSSLPHELVFDREVLELLLPEPAISRAPRGLPRLIGECHLLAGLQSLDPLDPLGVLGLFFRSLGFAIGRCRLSAGLHRADPFQSLLFESAHYGLNS
jgi:hypothetical protein